jgi:hypothetical protein
MLMERPPQQTWVQPYLPGLNPDQTGNLYGPEDPETDGVLKS